MVAVVVVKLHWLMQQQEGPPKHPWHRVHPSRLLPANRMRIVHLPAYLLPKQYDPIKKR
jgi:hypothetical protein